MKDLPRTEFVAQLEEAYARGTVALTRAQKLCIIMGPLDMRGLLGAAPVIGCLKYGAGLRGMTEKNRMVEMHLREASIDDGPDDCSFLDSLRRSLTTARGVYPPVAFAEIYCEDSRPSTKVRRLHLIVVDLDRSRNVGKRVYTGNFTRRTSLLALMSASTPCQFLRLILKVPTDADMCMAMALMDLTSQATCSGLAEGLITTFGLWIPGQVGSLIHQWLTLCRRSAWSTSSMPLP